MSFPAWARGKLLLRVLWTSDTQRSQGNDPGFETVVERWASGEAWGARSSLNVSQHQVWPSLSYASYHTLLILCHGPSYHSFKIAFSIICPSKHNRDSFLTAGDSSQIQPPLSVLPLPFT